MTDNFNLKKTWINNKVSSRNCNYSSRIKGTGHIRQRVAKIIWNLPPQHQSKKISRNNKNYISARNKYCKNAIIHKTPKKSVSRVKQ
jgi:hypothetical protein